MLRAIDRRGAEQLAHLLAQAEQAERVRSCSAFYHGTAAIVFDVDPAGVSVAGHSLHLGTKYCAPISIRCST